MKRSLFSSPTLIAALLATGLAACSGSTNTVTEVAACSTTYPTGVCATAGETCFGGTCVAAATLCSPTNLTGTCAANTTCLSGGCVVTSALCSPSNAGGLCDVNRSCSGGACVLDSSLCSSANPAGTCASGSTCFGGGCVANAQICSSTVPAGVCDLGKTCLNGGCVAVASLCSSSNTAGACPTGQACQAGACAAVGVDPCTVQVYTAQPTIQSAVGASSTPAGVLTVGGLKFKDLSKDGKLDAYEDWRLSEACRAKDLVSKLSAPEKIGLLGEGSTMGGGSVLPLSAGTTSNIVTLHLRQGLIRFGSLSSTSALAQYTNALQELAESQPWGIPIVLTTDPSHGFAMTTDATTGNLSVSLGTAILSAWPQPLGIGAINDAAVSQLYGDTIRREFMGLGFRWELGPQADLSTEPRWARVQSVFGENAYSVAKHVKATILGMQGSGVGGLKNGIMATVKHFPGAGPNQGGMDSHTRPGKYNVYPGNNFEYHQISFKAAIEAGAAALMPNYSIPKSITKYNPEQTGAALSKTTITDYLKTTLGYSGFVTSDWGTMSGEDWGVEGLTQPERAAQFLHAGSHQLGSDSVTIIQAAYDQGLVSDADLNLAAGKVLEAYFKLGIFENPYVDPTAVTVRTQANRDAGFIAQKKAMVILRNADRANSRGTKFLPIDGRPVLDTNASTKIEVYYDGVWDSITASAAKPDDVNDVYGDYDYTTAGSGTSTLPIVSVATPAAADLAVVRIVSRKGTYSGLDAGVPLSFDAPFTGVLNDGFGASAVKDRNRVIDLLRVRDGYTKSDGTVVPPANATLRIVLVMHMDRAGIVKPFINGLKTLDETSGVPGSYPVVSSEANILTGAAAVKGVDAFLVEFGAFDRAVLDVIFNKHLPTTPTGYVYGQARLPMEIPGSDADVAAQFEDLPADSANPTFGLGAGATF